MLMFTQEKNPLLKTKVMSILKFFVPIICYSLKLRANSWFSIINKNVSCITFLPKENEIVLPGENLSRDETIGEEDEKSESRQSGSVVLIISPEPSIRMLSPEPIELPPEFSSMKYSELNKVMLSMSSCGNEEDDTDSEDDDVFGSMEEEDKFDGSSDDDKMFIHNMKEEGKRQILKDVFLTSTYHPKGIYILYNY